MQWLLMLILWHCFIGLARGIEKFQSKFLKTYFKNIESLPCVFLEGIVKSLFEELQKLSDLMDFKLFLSLEHILAGTFPIQFPIS